MTRNYRSPYCPFCVESLGNFPNRMTASLWSAVERRHSNRTIHLPLLTTNGVSWTEGARDASVDPPAAGPVGLRGSARDHRRRFVRSGGSCRGRDGLRSRQPGRVHHRRLEARLPPGQRRRNRRHVLGELRLYHRVLRSDRREPRFVELGLSERLRAGLQLGGDGGNLHDLRRRTRRGILADLQDRHRSERVRRIARQRAQLLPGPARRIGVHPVGAPYRRLRT